jgi:hypothetical protein
MVVLAKLPQDKRTGNQYITTFTMSNVVPSIIYVPTPITQAIVARCGGRQLGLLFHGPTFFLGTLRPTQVFLS